MQLPHVRFKSGWVLLAVESFGLLFLAVPLLSVEKWLGTASIPLEFLILDSSTGRAIDGASVRLTEGAPEYRAASGPDGRARLIIRADTGGESWFGCEIGTRSVHYGRWALVISAEGYEGLNDDLNRFTQGARYHSDAVPPPIVIRLSSEPTKP
jgi:hypothetical protein